MPLNLDGIKVLLILVVFCVPEVSFCEGGVTVKDTPDESLRHFRDFSSFIPATYRPPKPNHKAQMQSYPERFDWREMGGVTPARQQGYGDCYPCWAFSLIGAIEGAAYILTGEPLDLSEQQILDCNTKGYGCEGGWIDGWTLADDYGCVLETCYPYEMADGECRQSDCEPVLYVVAAHPVASDPASLKEAIMNHGPVSCSMTVYPNFSFYKGGCYQHDGTEPINHGVVIAGWDDTMCDGAGAWIVKNSFGIGWGDEGFAYMKYGTCHIGESAQWFELALPEPPPTPQASELWYRLEASTETVGPGVNYQLTRTCGNPLLKSIPLYEFIILDIGGHFWYWPGWTEAIDYIQWDIGAGKTDIHDILSFTWPEDSTWEGSFTVWGAVLNSELRLLDMDFTNCRADQ